MGIRVLFVLITVIAALGCTTPVGISSYQKVGVVSLPSWRFSPNSDYMPPIDFKVMPIDVFTKFGNLCHATYNCTYFADHDSYYLLQNYGVVPSLSVSSHAVVIVDGRTGKLLKQP
jgi:hypothetical protein